MVDDLYTKTIIFIVTNQVDQIINFKPVSKSGPHSKKFPRHHPYHLPPNPSNKSLPNNTKMGVPTRHKFFFSLCRIFLHKCKFCVLHLPYISPPRPSPSIPLQNQAKKKSFKNVSNGGDMDERAGEVEGQSSSSSSREDEEQQPINLPQIQTGESGAASKPDFAGSRFRPRRIYHVRIHCLFANGSLCSLVIGPLTLALFLSVILIPSEY